jgi:fatty acid desaturase
MSPLARVKSAALSTFAEPLRPLARTQSNEQWFPLLRHSHWDALLVLLALLHGILLSRWPSILLIAFGFLWNSNTIAHYFIHLPFFKQPFWNRCFSAYQTLLLGVPQRLWRDRHLAHHADVRWRFKWSRQLIYEAGLVLTLWAFLLVIAPKFFLTVYVPGYALGLCLCFLQGHFEHARGTTSHYSRIYNSLFLNDGYHIEHHAHPSAHWLNLHKRRAERARSSRWPAALRWIESINLETLEFFVLRSKVLQRFVLNRHQIAFQSLLKRDDQPGLKSVAIVGGGLFPRTALVLRKLLPQCALTVIEENPEHIAIARRWLNEGVEYVAAHYDGAFARRFDAIVIPLAFRGNREELCAKKAAKTLFVHDWIWRRRKKSRVISWLLLKRLNRVDA